MDTHKCQGVTKADAQCRKNALSGETRCRTHATVGDAKIISSPGKCVTITFSDVVENGVGMEQIGTRLFDLGRQFTPGYLRMLAEKYPGSRLIDLSLLPSLNSSTEDASACVLIIPGFCAHPEEALQELLALQWDTKALFRGQVKNKLARHNLCFSESSREACYEQGKGTVIGFDQLPLLSEMREKVKRLIPQGEGEESFTPQAEGNLYYDVSKTYIGLHGDTERTFVIGLRLGEQIPLHFQWFLKTEKLGEKTTVQFSPGDAYVMSFKAVGTDWKKRLIPTLRHAAGDIRLIKKL